MDHIQQIALLIVGLASFVTILISVWDFPRGVAIWLALMPVVWSIRPPVEALDVFSILRLQEIALAVIWVLEIQSGRLRLIGSQVTKAYFAFLAASVLSAIASKGGLDSLLRALTYIEPLIWFLISASIAHSLKNRVRELILGLVVGLAIVVAYGFYEFLFQTNPMVSYGLLHLDVDYLEDLRLSISGRISSTIGQPVYTAAYFLMLLPVCFFYQRTSTNSIIAKGLIWGILITGVFLLFLTGTRAAYATIPLMVASYYFACYGFKKSLGYFVVYGVATVLFLYAALPEEFLLFLQNSFSVGGEASNEAANFIFRIALTERLFSLFLESPFLGFGPGFINKTAALPIVSGFQGLEGQENHFLMILADGGILGAVTYAVFMIVTFRLIRNGIKALIGQERQFAILITVLFVGLFFFSVSAMMLNSPVMHILMILTGIHVGNLQNEKDEKTGKARALSTQMRK